MPRGQVHEKSIDELLDQAKSQAMNQKLDDLHVTMKALAKMEAEKGEDYQQAMHTGANNETGRTILSQAMGQVKGEILGKIQTETGGMEDFVQNQENKDGSVLHKAHEAVSAIDTDKDSTIVTELANDIGSTLGQTPRPVPGGPIDTPEEADEYNRDNDEDNRLRPSPD